LRVLIVTGMMAKDTITEILSQNGFDCEVRALPVPVASLMSPEYVSRMLEGEDLSNIDLILIPGLIGGDASKIEMKTGIKTWKGPKNAADIPVVLKAVEKLKLSTILPADELVRRANLLEVERAVAKIEREGMRGTARKEMITVGAGKGKVLLGSSLPMRVLAEIVDASSLSTDEIKRIARLYEAVGADIIDVGMVAGGGHPKDSVRAVKAVKESVRRPVSIDASDPEEIEAAVDAGVDLILSVNAENMEEIAKFAADIPVVVTSAGKHHVVAEDVDDRLRQLNLNIERARSLGFEKIIADPILTPLMTPSLAKSVLAYLKFRDRDSKTPLLFGAGNVTELIDADSIGANLLLAGLAAEVGANILLTTEASTKTVGSVKETVRVAKMVTLARARKSPPKDLGIDLLVMKEKRWREEPPRIYGRVERLSAVNLQEFIHDPKGSFKIAVDRRRNGLVLVHYSYGRVKPDLIIRGSDPERLICAAVSKKLISRLEHASYLGRELERARIALETGKSYVQDLQLLFGRD